MNLFSTDTLHIIDILAVIDDIQQIIEWQSQPEMI